MQIIFADTYGFCNKAKRAVNIVYNTLKNSSVPTFIFGPLIHNPQETKNMQSAGLKIINKISELQKIEYGNLIIPTHGVPVSVVNLAKEKNINLIDLTCPYVKRVFKYVKLLKENSYDVIIVGDKMHREVKNILQYYRKADVVENVKDLKSLQLKEKIGIVSQTTQSLENFKNIVDGISDYTKKVKIYKTICPASSLRQKSAIKLAKKTNLVFVIGGRNSANTTRLYQISKNINKNTYHIETEKEIKSEHLKNADKIGITAGTSTPDWIIQNVVERIKFLSAFS